MRLPWKKTWNCRKDGHKYKTVSRRGARTFYECCICGQELIEDDIVEMEPLILYKVEPPQVYRIEEIQ